MNELHWPRILIFAGAGFTAAMLIAFASGFSMAHWEIYGPTMEEATANARLVRRIGYFVVGVVVYGWFTAGVATRHALHAVLLFATVQIIDVLFSMIVFGVRGSDLFDAAAFGRSAAAAATGFALGVWFRRLKMAAP